MLLHPLYLLCLRCHLSRLDLPALALSLSLQSLLRIYRVIESSRVLEEEKKS